MLGTILRTWALVFESFLETCPCTYVPGRYQVHICIQFYHDLNYNINYVQEHFILNFKIIHTKQTAIVVCQVWSPLHESTPSLLRKYTPISIKVLLCQKSTIDNLPHMCREKLVALSPKSRQFL